MVKFSVIIQINNSEYLEECLDSVINQTLKDIEIICVNISSEENIKNLLKEYENKNNRVKIIKQKKNKIKEVIKVSKGEYIIFLDDNDKLPINTLESIYEIFSKYDNINVDISEDDSYIKNKKFYNYRLNCFKEIIDYFIEDKKIPKFIQNIILYKLKSFEYTQDFPKEMKKEEIAEFWKILYSILEYIDDEVILNNLLIKNKHFRNFLIYIKNHQEFHIEKDKKGTILLKTNNYIINNLKNQKIYFDIIELKDDVLNISGNLVSSCSNDAIYIEATKKNNGKKETYKGKYIEYPNTPRKINRYLGIDWKFNYNFELKIPINKKGESKINIYTVYDEDGDKIKIKNKFNFRKFAEINSYSYYYIKNSQILAYINNSFNIIPYKYSKALRLEISSFKKILRSKEKNKFNSIFYRLLYLLFLPKMKNKKIYLFMDRRDNTGDNGEHLFRYASEQKDDISKYFAVEKDCKQYKKLKKDYGNKILEFGSFKHKFIYMFTEKFIGSQGYKKYINPFADKNLKLTQGISSPPVYFLQHGVGKYDTSNWLRKYDINFSLLLTVSDLDQKAFVENYNYDEEIIQELGFPRYDNLTKKNLKKEVVIIPTWRKPLKTKEDLLNSEYYTRWNNLLNNKELIEFAEEKGYKIIYKPHPNSVKFLDLFNTNNVIIDTKRRFHDILCESALMITDYSSVHFDFAYLKKPIIYYQYGTDFHFEGKPLIDDDKSTFGEIIKDEDILINKIKEYILNNCEMEEEYKTKVNTFFKFNDKNNCKRVYDWILKH